MSMIFAVDYNDGKVRASAGDDVPHHIPAHRLAILKRARVIEDKPDELTVEEYVDGYISGRWKDDVPPDVEQFAANHAPEIETEFQRRAALDDENPVAGDDAPEADQ